MKPKRCAPLLVLLLIGCVTPGPGMVGLKPDGSPGPEPCPAKALANMALLRLHPGHASWVDVDQSKIGMRNVTINDGPIESILQQPLGPSVLDTGTHLYGKVWTSGPYIVIRYYEARPPDSGEPFAICAIARLDEGGLKKKPGPAPGSAVLEISISGVVIVDGFR